MKVLRCLVPLLAIAALLATAAPASAASGCSGADATVSERSASHLRGVTLCLLNRERTSRGMKKLKSNKRLRKAAERYSKLMVKHRFFNHVSPGGSTMLDRLKRVGYLGGGAWQIGENIAWGEGSLGTPRRIVRSWMNSSGHRANILNRSFREIGIGIAKGTPRGSRGATYTTDFGRRG
jgi:uncharacterized protein YkwD